MDGEVSTTSVYVGFVPSKNNRDKQQLRKVRRDGIGQSATCFGLVSESETSAGSNLTQAQCCLVHIHKSMACAIRTAVYWSGNLNYRGLAAIIVLIDKRSIARALVTTLCLIESN